mgnify:CR=1 FL=1
MKRVTTLLAGLCLFSSVQAEIVNIGNAELERLTAQGVPLIDIRTEPEWRASGLLAGSRALTFFDAQGRANPEAWLKRVESFAPPGQPIILICRSGNRSRAAAEYLEQRGRYAKVYNVTRGVQGWAGEGRPFVAPGTACLAGERC